MALSVAVASAAVTFSVASAAMTFSVAVASAAVAFLVAVMAAHGVGIVSKLSCQQLLHPQIRVAGHSGIQLNLPLRQRHPGSLADSSADQHIHPVLLQEGCQGSVAIAVGGENPGADYLPILNLINLKLL